MKKLRLKLAQAMPNVWYWKIRNKAFRSKVVLTPLHLYYSKKRRSSRSSPEPQYLKKGGEASTNGDTPSSTPYFPFPLQDDDGDGEVNSMRKRSLLLREILEEDKPCIGPFLSSSRRYDHHSSREHHESGLKENSIMQEEDKACISTFLSRRQDEGLELRSYDDCKQKPLAGECCVTTTSSSLKNLAEDRPGQNQFDLLELQCKLKSLLNISDEFHSTVCDATPPSIVLPSTPASSVQLSECQAYVFVNNQHNSPALKVASGEMKSIRGCHTSSSSSTDSTRHIVSSSSDAGLSSSPWDRDFSSLASTVSSKLQDNKKYSFALEETIAMKMDELREHLTSKEIFSKTKSKDISPDCSGRRLTSSKHNDEKHENAFIKQTLLASYEDDTVSFHRCSPPASILSHSIMSYDGYRDCQGSHESEVDSASKSFKKLHRTSKPRKQLDFSKETVSRYGSSEERHIPHQRSTSRVDTFRHICSSPDSSSQRHKHAATPKKHCITVSAQKPEQRRNACQEEDAFQALLATQRRKADSQRLESIQRSRGLEPSSTPGHVQRNHGYLDEDSVDSRRLSSCSFRCGFDSSSNSLPYDLEYTGYDHHWEIDHSKDDPPLLRSLSRRSAMASDRRSGRKLSPGGKTKDNKSDVDKRCSSRRENSLVNDGKGSVLGSVPTTVAMVKCSQDPRKDFKDSMVEMISERGIGHHDSVELVELLRCYLSLNSRRYHDTIISVFVDLWSQLASTN